MSYPIDLGEDDFAVGQPSPEEEAEASFYFFIQDLNHYAQSGKFGPRIWEAASEETRRILTNQVVFNDVGPKFTEILNGNRL
jgi:hypothetical protein